MQKQLCVPPTFQLWAPVWQATAIKYQRVAFSQRNALHSLVLVDDINWPMVVVRMRAKKDAYCKFTLAAIAMNREFCSFQIYTGVCVRR